MGACPLPRAQPFWASWPSNANDFLDDRFRESLRHQKFYFFLNIGNGDRRKV